MKIRSHLPKFEGGSLGLAVSSGWQPVQSTPPVRRWKRGEVPLLFAHATAFVQLAATSRSAKASRHRYTVLVAPVPNTPKTSYLPTRFGVVAFACSGMKLGQKLPG